MRFIYEEGIEPRIGKMNSDSPKKIKSRVNRIAGQVAGIQRMVDEGRYWGDNGDIPRR